MLANGSAWSSFPRTTSHGCGPMRGGWILTFIALILAIADGDRATSCVDGFLGELQIGDLLDGRLLVPLNIPILNAVLDRPLRARRTKPGIDRPDAVLGLDVDCIFDGFLRL